MFKRLIIMAAALSITACTPTLSPTTPAAPVGDKVIVLGNVALADAADAYTVVATGVAAAIRNGAFSNERLAQIRTLNNRALQLIEGGQAGLSVAERAAGLTVIVTQLRSMIGS